MSQQLKQILFKVKSWIILALAVGAVVLVQPIENER